MLNVVGCRYVNKKFLANICPKLFHWQQMLDDETHMSPATAKIECGRCIIGESIAVQLVVASKKAAVVIPYEAVFIRDGKQFVYKFDQGKAVLTAVTLGIHEQELVEIAAGLKAQDKIVVRGQARLSPGESVTPSYN